MLLCSRIPLFPSTYLQSSCYYLLCDRLSKVIVSIVPPLFYLKLHSPARLAFDALELAVEAMDKDVNVDKSVFSTTLE